VALLFAAFPAIALVLYQKGLFQIIRVVIDHSIALLPFPLIILVVIATPFFLFIYFKRNYIHKKSLLLVPLNIIGWTIAVFFIFWGYNYTCPKHISSKSAPAMTIEDLYTFGQAVAHTTNETRQHCHGLSFVYEDNDVRSSMEVYCQSRAWRSIVNRNTSLLLVVCNAKR